MAFTWRSDNRVTSVRDPAGDSFEYGYANLFINGTLRFSILGSADYPSPLGLIEYRYPFHVGSASQPQSLLGVRLDGLLSFNYEYFSEGRVSRSGPVVQAGTITTPMTACFESPTR